MINKKQAVEILNAGLATGSDYAEIFIEDKESETITVENGKVEQNIYSYLTGLNNQNDSGDFY